MSFLGFGRKPFGRKGMAPAPIETRKSGDLFGNRGSGNGGTYSGGTAFDRFMPTAVDMATNSSYPTSGCYKALQLMSPEERGELLSDMADKPGIYDGYRNDSPIEKQIVNSTLSSIWQTEIEVRKEHLAAMLSLLLDNKSYRLRNYYDRPINTLMRLIKSAIKQGAYLSSSDCEALAEMASDMRNFRSSYRKADTKKMIALAEKIEKLAGIEVSATEFLLKRCEGADNDYAIADKPRPNAQFWADLLAEVAATLDEVRVAMKGSSKPQWARNQAEFGAFWPACGDVRPCFETWKKDAKPLANFKEYNGKRYGWADPEDYRELPSKIASAVAHSRYDWSSEHIPGLDVLGNLENPDWTALIEHLITQRRSTKSTKKWQKEALALCEPLGLETVEERLHNWLALFCAPALGRQNYTSVLNGERFAPALDRLEEAHPDWPQRYAGATVELGRAVAICVVSSWEHGLCRDFHPQLVRCDDHSYKNKSVTDGVLHLPKPNHRAPSGQSIYKTLSSWMRVGVENEEFLRGALWLVGLMPNRARAIHALEHTALSAATYMWTGDDGMRSKIIANAAIATLIDLGGSDIDPAVLRLSKLVEHRTVKAPLLTYLNAER